MCSIERSDVYLVNESSKLESVNRVHEVREKSHSLLDHPRSMVRNFNTYKNISLIQQTGTSPGKKYP